MVFDTVMTCNECQAQNVYYPVEWPPQICVCNECGQVFKVSVVAKTGRIQFEMVPRKL